MEKVEKTTTTSNRPHMSHLPDVAGEVREQVFLPLDWVGMDEIEIPVKLENSGFLVMAKVRAQVSLDLGNSRGIHMSRIYALIQDQLAGKVLSISGLKALSVEFLRTHQGLSQSAKLQVRFHIPIKRKALKSDLLAYRTYPVSLTIVNLGGQVHALQEIEVLYSSTCPASAALSRQLIGKKFVETFGSSQEYKKGEMLDNLVSVKEVETWLAEKDGLYATPHAQRSRAVVRVESHNDNLEEFHSEDLIDLIENTLKTPVQTLVKREDEQEFALLNGQNLLFCEDAVRRIAAALEGLSGSLNGFWARVEHFESLHPHNAVAEKSRNWNPHFSTYFI